TKRRPALEADGLTLAGDMRYGEQNKAQILALAPTFGLLDKPLFEPYYIDEHFKHMHHLFSLTAWGELALVANKWLKHFRQNQGGIFYSRLLTAKVKQHTNTVLFLDGVQRRLNHFLKQKYDK